MNKLEKKEKMGGKWTTTEEELELIDGKKKQETLKIAETVNNNDPSTAPRMIFNQMSK